MIPVEQATPSFHHASFEFYAPDAREVSLVGEFNDWNRASTPLHRSADGNWHVQLMLPPGIYRYKFVVDAAWRCSPDHAEDRCDRPCQACPRCVPNVYGSFDRVVIV
jgi:1,4-alpha-glucan branching enzyme